MCFFGMELCVNRQDRNLGRHSFEHCKIKYWPSRHDVHTCAEWQELYGNNKNETTLIELKVCFIGGFPCPILQIC